MKPLKVLLVANTLPPADVSGVGEQVLQLAAGLRERGHEVRVLGRGGEGARGPKLLFPLAIGRPLARAVRTFDPDVVQVHEGDAGLAFQQLRSRRDANSSASRRRPLLVALQQVSYVEERDAVRPLMFEGRILGVPGSVELRFRKWKAPLQIRLGVRTAQSADLVLAPSAATAAELVRDYGAHAPEVLPNVTSELPFGEMPAGTRPSPSAFPFNAASAEGRDAKFLLFVGRLRIRKGVEVLLEAVHGLVEKGRAANLVIAGDGEHRAALEARAAALALGARVRFLGRTSAADVRALMSRAAALVVPSTYEGMPLVVLEAMASGLPVIASRVSGIPEVVLDGETGWLVPKENPPELAAAIDALTSNPNEALRRGSSGRARVEACYRPRHAAALWESIVRARLEESA